MFASPVQEGELVADRYRVGRILGQGGMGVVVQAADVELHRPVAIKFLLSDRLRHEDAFQRFKREARAMAQIASEYAVRVYDSGRLAQGEPFIVMEWLNGQDLDAQLESTGPLPVEQAVDFALQACEGLAVAHAHGIVHRDIKPGNLFVEQRSDGTRRLKLLDFGLAKPLVGESVTASEHVLGSPAYMSPEQIRAPRSVDTRSDIWSLGAVLFEAMTGKRPFQGDNALAICAAIISTEPVLPDEGPQTIPEGLRAVVLRCLAREQNDRFADVAELADALAPFGGPSAASVPARTRCILRSGVPLADISGPVEVTESGGSGRWSSGMTAKRAALRRRSGFAAAALICLGLGIWWWTTARVPEPPGPAEVSPVGDDAVSAPKAEPHSVAGHVASGSSGEPSRGNVASGEAAASPSPGASAGQDSPSVGASGTAGAEEMSAASALVRRTPSQALRDPQRDRPMAATPSVRPAVAPPPRRQAPSDLYDSRQ